MVRMTQAACYTVLVLVLCAGCSEPPKPLKGSLVVFNGTHQELHVYYDDERMKVDVGEVTTVKIEALREKLPKRLVARYIKGGSMAVAEEKAIPQDRFDEGFVIVYNVKEKSEWHLVDYTQMYTPIKEPESWQEGQPAMSFPTYVTQEQVDEMALRWAKKLKVTNPSGAVNVYAQDVIPEGAGLPGEIEANRKVFRVERDPKVADHLVAQYFARNASR